MLEADDEAPLSPTALAALLLEIAGQLHRAQAAPLVRTGALAHLARRCAHGKDPSLHER
ncbi:hypothetical protein [Kineococcus sp. SYSU DK005]|uniref:hypothetical protein n=1 Tax=Kineococcus sp. SYSU DK005 TaxID=3383126 RepID=UPI003D7C9B87